MCLLLALKADILRKIVTAETVVNYLNQARMRNPDSKSLYLYEIRYLLDIKQSQEAWKLLLNAHSQFIDDEEITLLAALVSLDIEKYDSADQLFNTLRQKHLLILIAPIIILVSVPSVSKTWSKQNVILIMSCKRIWY